MSSESAAGGNSINTRHGSNADEDNTQQVLDIQLLEALRQKDVKRANKLLNRGASATYADTARWQPIHYAATHGYLEFMNQLIKHGASTTSFDSNGETPLHKAARRGHLDCMITLLTQGAVVGTVNWKGQSALELGVIERNVKVVETLMLFGAEPVLRDMTWASMDNLTDAEEKILAMIHKQLSRAPGYSNGIIAIDSAYVQPRTSPTFKNVQLTVDATKISSPFHMFCTKTQTEYEDFLRLPTNGAKIFSDIYEVRVWKLSGNRLTLKMVIPGIPNLNERAFLISPAGNVGSIMNTERQVDSNETVIAADIRLGSNGITRFAVAIETRREKILVSKETVVIKPIMEPDATISIPKNTFDNKSEMSLCVMDTKSANEDEKDEAMKSLVTNILDISMSDRQQPKLAVEMKLPMHMSSDDICALTTSTEEPETEGDWEVIKAKSDTGKSQAIFEAAHFSIYVGAKKKMVLEDKARVVQAIHRSLRKERKIEFLVFTRFLDDQRGNFELVVECVIIRKLERRKLKWARKDYTLQDTPRDVHVIEENQSFKLNVEGNMKEVTEAKELKLDFVGRRGYKFVVFNMVVCDTCALPDGKISVDIEDKVEVANSAEVVHFQSCCTNTNRVQPIEKVVYSMFKPFTSFTFAMVLPKVKQGIETTTQSISASETTESYFRRLAGDLDTNFPSTLPEMTAQRLVRTGMKLTEEEGTHLGYQLLTTRDIEMLLNSHKVNIGVHVLLKYRGMRPHPKQIRNIATALLAINRKDLHTEFITDKDMDM